MSKVLPKSLFSVGKNTCLRDTLRLLMKLNGIKQNDIVQKTGIGSGTICRLMTDDSANPTIDTLATLAKLFKVTISQLLGELPLSTPLVPKNLNDLNNVPLLDFSNIGKFLTEGILPDNYENITTDAIIYNNSFALKMVGNSMDPIFPDGTILIFTPQEKFKDYAYVLIELSGVYVFKQLIIDTPNYFLRSINPDIMSNSLIKLPGKNSLKATLVQAKHDYIF